tara:strand:- start:15810 stop:16067 length:258 start_codon:yes stop_codon:yes gene_type:complete
MIRNLLLLGTVVLMGAQAPRATPAQDAPKQDAVEQGAETRVAAAKPEHIAWYSNLDDALAEAKRTNRPVLVHAAAPQCSGVPGMW